jgi:hypothetical protein
MHGHVNVKSQNALILSSEKTLQLIEHGKITNKPRFNAHPIETSVLMWWCPNVSESYFSIKDCLLKPLGARGDVVVKALRYKPACRGFDSRWRHWNFSVS